MSALGKLVVSLALNHAEYTQGLDRSSQEALKFAQNSQKSFDQAEQSAKEFFSGVAAGAVGVIGSIVGIDAAITRTKQNIDILASLDDAAQKTGSSVEDLSRIQKTAKNFGDDFGAIEQSISRLAKGLGSFDDEGNQAMRALDAIGVSARDSNDQLRTSADVYIDVAKSLQQYKDGAEKTAVVNALFGKSGADQLPILNNLARGIDDVTASSAGSAQQADEFNDALARSNAAVDSIFEQLAQNLLPTLLNIAAATNLSSGSFGEFSATSSVVATILKGIAIAGRATVDVISEVGRQIGGTAAQLVALANLDFKGAFFIGEERGKDLVRATDDFNQFVDTVLNGDKRLAAATTAGGMKKTIDFALNMPAAVNASTQAIEKQTKAFDIELHKLKEYESEAKRARDITESVATKQERYNQTLEELERLKPYMSVEAYTRALDKAERELQDVGAVNRQVTSEMDQLWIQAGRNIQSTFANSIFDFVDDGFDGMWRNAKTAVGRILSEFAALKLSQSIGLSALFAIPGSATAAGGIGGAGAAASGGSSLLSNVGSGAGIMSLLKGGASGITSGISGMMSGGGLGAFALPMLGAFALNTMSNAFAGDKTLGNGFTDFMQKIPVLGAGWDIVAGLFGRGPMKQQGTSLTGQIGAEGFESGSLSTRFKARGGLFRSDKIDFANVDAVTGAISTDNGKLSGFANDLAKVAKDTFSLINETTQQTSSSLRSIADDLGISSDSIDNFSYSISVLSEKGKMLTDEQIAGEITKISDSLARGLIPQVDGLAKRGESALQTVARLGSEFTTLSDAATILGKSVAESRAFIAGSSFEGRTGFVDAAGGIDALNQKAAFFAQNFLTDTERLAPAQERLNDELNKLNLSTDLTKDQFRDLVQSFGQVNGISEDTLQALLNLQGGFLEVRNTSEALAAQAKEQAKAQVNNAYSALQKSVETERNRATKEYNDALKTANDRINDVNESINKMSSLANVLKSATDSLMPLGLGSARAQIQSAINSARAGSFPEAESIQRALSVLANQGTDAFSTRLDFMRSQAQSASMVNELSSLTNDQLTLDQRSLAALEANRDRLTEGFNTQMAQLDAVLADAQQQIDLLGGINTTLLSIDQAMGNFNLRSVQAGGAAIGGVAPAGNPGITDQQINDYFKSPRTPAEIARDAANNGVSSQQIMLATGFTQGTVDQFFKDNPKIPRFATGASFVPRTGLSIVERGERIFNTEQNQDLIGAIKQLVREVQKGTVSSDGLRSLIRDAMEETDSGLAMRQVSAA